jgi:hypothetical protein
MKQNFISSNFKRFCLSVTIMGSLFLGQGCAPDSDATTATAAATVKHPTSAFKRTRPISLSAGTITTQSHLMNADHGCYTIQVNVFQEDDDATVWLVATSIIQVGPCSHATPSSNKEGAVHENWVASNTIIFDDICVKWLWETNTAAYNDYLSQRRTLIGY